MMLKHTVIILIILLMLGSCSDGRDTSSSLTVEDVLHERGSLIGETVMVRGRVGLMYLNCTEAECPEDNQCCNGCGGAMALGEENISIGDEIGASLVPDTPDMWLISDPDRWFFYSNDVIALRSTDQLSFRCAGNSCELTCQPLQPGEIVTITGVVQEEYSTTILEVESFEYD